MEIRGQDDSVEYRTLVEKQVPTVLYAGSADEMRVLYIGPQVEGMIGYAQEERLSDTQLCLKTIYPEDRERVLAEEARAYETCGPYEAEYRRVARDGQEVWVREGAVRSEDGEGRRSGGGPWRGIVLDVTGRKRAEESLKRSEERHRLVAKATGEAIRDNDLLTGRQEWDGATEAFFGHPARQSASGEWWEERIHPEDRGRVLSGLEAVLNSGGEAWSEEYRFLRADGSYAAVVDRGHVARDERGRPVRMVGAMADITEKKRAEEALRESEERFRLAFEAAAVGMAHAAPDGRWLRVNRKLCEILDCGREEFMAMTFWGLTPPEERNASLERVRRMLEGKLGPYIVERRFLKKEGLRIWTNVAVSLVRGHSGEPRYFFCVVEDITERKLAELVPDPLTSREIEVLKLIARWKTNRNIAQSLAYSVSTIKLYVQSIFDKLKVRDRREAVARAVEIGLITPQR